MNVGIIAIVGLVTGLIGMGIGIHNIPGGIALGSLFYISYIEGISLAIILILHGIPEAIELMEARHSSSSIILGIIIGIFITSLVH